MLVLRTSTPSLLPTPMELLFLLMSLLWLLPVLTTLLLGVDKLLLLLLPLPLLLLPLLPLPLPPLSLLPLVTMGMLLVMELVAWWDTPTELWSLWMSLLLLLPVLATLLPREEFIKNRKARTMIVICAISSHCNQCEFCSNYQKIYKAE